MPRPGPGPEDEQALIMDACLEEMLGVDHRGAEGLSTLGRAIVAVYTVMEHLIDRGGDHEAHDPMQLARSVEEINYPKGRKNDGH